MSSFAMIFESQYPSRQTATQYYVGSDVHDTHASFGFSKTLAQSQGSVLISTRTPNKDLCYFRFEDMAFVNRIGNVLKQTVSKHAGVESCASNSMLYQAIRSMSTKLFVGGLSYGTDEASLSQAFSQHGEVVEARIITDRDNGRSRGFGFVTFSSSEDASRAMQAMDNQDLHGRRLRVNFATEKPRAPRYDGGFNSGGGGGFGGYQGYGGGAGGYGGGGGYDRRNFGEGGYNSGASNFSGGAVGGNFASDNSAFGDNASYAGGDNAPSSFGGENFGGDVGGFGPGGDSQFDGGSETYDSDDKHSNDYVNRSG